MLYGINRPHNVAVIVASVPAVEKFAEKNGISVSQTSLLSEPEIIKLFQEQLEHYGKDFKSFERPKNFALLSEEWSIDNGLLTPTLKLKREVVEEQFKSLIESLYS